LRRKRGVTHVLWQHDMTGAAQAMRYNRRGERAGRSLGFLSQDESLEESPDSIGQRAW